MANKKLSQFSAASVDSNTELVGLKTVLGVSTDYRFAIGNLATYLADPSGIQVVAYDRHTAQTAAVATVVTYTVGGTDATFEVSANVLITTATSFSMTLQVSYTDEGNTARSFTIPTYDLSGGLVAAINNGGGAVPYTTPPFHIRCKAATAITVATVGSFTTVTYNVEGAIKEIPNI